MTVAVGDAVGVTVGVGVDESAGVVAVGVGVGVGVGVDSGKLFTRVKLASFFSTELAPNPLFKYNLATKLTLSDTLAAPSKLKFATKENILDVATVLVHVNSQGDPALLVSPKLGALVSEPVTGVTISESL